MKDIFWLLGIVGTPILFFIFEQLVPSKLPQTFDPFEMKRKAERYDKFEAYALLIIFPSAIVIGYSVYHLGLYISNSMLSDRYIYIQQAPIAFWGILGFVLGIGLLRIPMTLIYKAILKNEYELYLAYTNQKHRWDGLKVWKVIETTLSSIGILLFILGTNWYVRIDTNNDKIEFKTLLSLKTFSYPISRISEISHSPKVILSKDKTIKEVFTIKVDTTYVWNSKYYGYFTDIEDDFIHLSDRVHYLSDYAQIPIIEEK